MKNKKLVKILLPLVFIIWGLIIYRVISYVTGNNTVDIVNVKSAYHIKNKTQTDTFTIVANYRDPFDTETIKKKVAKKNPSKKTNNKQAKKTEPKIIWPHITYKGRVQNNSSSKKLSILKINNKNYMMFENEEKENVLLKKIYKDSAIVEYSNQQKIIYLKSINK